MTRSESRSRSWWKVLLHHKATTSSKKTFELIERLQPAPCSAIAAKKHSQKGSSNGVCLFLLLAFSFHSFRDDKYFETINYIYKKISREGEEKTNKKNSLRRLRRPRHFNLFLRSFLLTAAAIKLFLGLLCFWLFAALGRKEKKKHWNCLRFPRSARGFLSSSRQKKTFGLHDQESADIFKSLSLKSRFMIRFGHRSWWNVLLLARRLNPANFLSHFPYTRLTRRRNGLKPPFCVEVG